MPTESERSSFEVQQAGDQEVARIQREFKLSELKRGQQMSGEMAGMTYGAPRSLHRKLAQVMYEAERIPKNGVAPAAMGGFRFVQVGDAADVIRKALAEHSVSMLPTSVELLSETEHETASGKSMTTITVRTTWTLTDGDSGESVTMESMGSGADMGDKAIPKAQSNSMKYALLVGFLLSTGDDPELADSSDRRPKRDGGSLGVLPPNRPPLERTTHDDGLIGKVATSGNQDFNLRETPDGWILPFRVRGGVKAGQIVMAHDDLARALEPFRDALMDQRVTVWGRYTDETSTKANGYVVGYKVLHLSRIKWADGELPVRWAELPVDVSPADSVALFPDDDLGGLPAEWGPAR